MNRLRDRMYRFMYGRYGMDQYSKFLLFICLVLLIITLFSDNFIIYTLAILGLVYTYFRVFSKNISVRAMENQRYLKIYYSCVSRFNRFKARMKDKRTHRIFKCPGCSQKIRVPKNKGRISIKCPKCRIEFIKKT
ncbi:MAG: hypothetical protein ACI4E1_06485 [Lachnospira sp.]